MPTNRELWEEAYAESKLRDTDFTTMSGIPLDAGVRPRRRRVPGSVSRTPAARTRRCTARSCGRCGCSPASAPPTTPTGGSRRSSRPAATGCRRRSTCRRCSASTPTTRWRSARSGAAAWRSTRLADMEDLYAGIDLGQITTSMTINSPAAVIFAMFVAQAEKAGVDRARLGGTLQNDILKEYQAQKEFVFPPRPSMRLVRDTIAFTAAEMPRWHSISISGYHIREAGSTAAEELAFTLANGFAYVELAMQAGLPGRRVRAAALVLLQRPHRLLRGDRQVPRRPADLGALDARPLRRPERAVDAAALPHPDRRRVAHRAAARGQHRAHRDRGAGRRARRHAVAAHQLDGRGDGPADREGGPHRAAHTTGDRATRPTSPTSPTRSGGSYFVESLTDEMERQAEELFAHLDETRPAARCSRA